MLDDQVINQATEEVVKELNLTGWKFKIEPAMASPHEDARQIRLFDSEGNDKAVVVSFQDADGRASGDKEDIKAKIRKQLKTLTVISE